MKFSENILTMSFVGNRYSDVAPISRQTRDARSDMTYVS